MSQIAKEHHGLGGRLTIVLRDRQGNELLCRQVDNLITTQGRRLLARFLAGMLSGRPALSIAVGSGDQAAAEGDTALGKQQDEVAVDGPTVGSAPGAGGQVEATVAATLPATGKELQQDLTEAGILVRLPDEDPVLYNRVVFPVVTRTGNMEMTLSWKVLF